LKIINQINFDAFSTFWNKKFVILIVFTFFAVWSFPNLLEPVQGGLDPSWEVGMHIAKLSHFVWGEDIVWTYGPLSYLLNPIPIDYNLWTNSILYKSLSHLIFFAILALFSIKQKLPLRYVLIIGIISFLFAKFTIYSPLIGLLIGFYLYLSYDPKKFWLVFLSLACAILIFIKFDMAITSFGLLIITCIFLLKQKKQYEAILSLSSYTIFVIFIWYSMGGSLPQLTSYVLNSLEVSSGYSAMSIDTYQIFTTPFAISSWILLFLILSLQKFRPTNPKLLFLSILPLFIFFKLGVVRNDIFHIITFLLGWTLLLFIYYSSIYKNKERRSKKFVSDVLVGTLMFSMLVVSSSQVFNDSLSDKIPNGNTFFINNFLKSDLQWLPKTMEFIAKPELFQALVDESKNNVRSQYPQILPYNLETLRGKTTDIIPWDISLLYAYDIDWKPRPVIQSFNAYTSKLDDLNSKHFLKNDSPEFVIYKVQSIDGRFPFFDEPSTLRTILCNYRTVGSMGSFWILEKATDNCTKPKLLSTHYTKFNQTINTPSHHSDYLFAKIETNYNLYGKISDVFYKPPQIRVIINEELNARFIPKTASNGILLSASDKVQNVNPMLYYDINSLRLITDESFFDKNIKVEFFEVNANLDTFPAN